MARYLATFSGKFGDILWSLPTVKCFSEMIVGQKLDFCMMPAYKSLIPLLEQQPYIDKAFAAEDWTYWHDNYGCQPWNAPQRVHEPYEKAWDLAYRCHPGLHCAPTALIDFVAQQQGLKLKDPYPFLFPQKPAVIADLDWSKTVMYSFNNQYAESKIAFFDGVKRRLPDMTFVNCQDFKWEELPYYMQKALCFVGCRSSNNVIAHGVNQRNIFIFEPHPSRHAKGMLGQVFGSPYLEEVTAPMLMPPEAAAEYASSTVKGWYQTKEKEASQCAC